MNRLFPALALWLGVAFDAVAQCAICRSTLESNVSQGDPGIAAGINTGILYLLVFPYAAAIIIGYMWYRNAKKHRKTARLMLE
ncbi:MAG: hypothetical protein KatS3mg032_0518 [Cyclobacteriaceae bacterium]|nr:MAG: hypothetical protein KatS3mg032_0518 [Cyclobacteriaceae bacterium]